MMSTSASASNARLAGLAHNRARGLVLSAVDVVMLSVQRDMIWGKNRTACKRIVNALVAPSGYNTPGLRHSRSRNHAVLVAQPGAKAIPQLLYNNLSNNLSVLANYKASFMCGFENGTATTLQGRWNRLLPRRLILHFARAGFTTDQHESNNINMKNSLWVMCGWAVLATALAFLSSSLSASAATLSVSPSIVSNTYSGMVTLDITGLTNGEPVIVEKFLDFNGNGSVDLGEPLWQSLKLADGQMTTIGGATNWNVPGDLNGASGSITANLNFTAMEVDHLVSKYAFRLSSPFGRFTPVTNVFQITNAAYSQSVTGTVRNGPIPVPYAWVVLLLGLASVVWMIHRMSARRSAPQTAGEAAALDEDWDE